MSYLPPGPPGPPPGWQPYSPYPQAPPGAPAEVVTARVILWIQGVVSALLALIYLAAFVNELAHLGGESEPGYQEGRVAGALIVLLIAAAQAAVAITLTVRAGPGRAGVRTGILVYEGILTALGALGLVGAVIAFAVNPIPALLVLVVVTLVVLSFPVAALVCLRSTGATQYFARRW